MVDLVTFGEASLRLSPSAGRRLEGARTLEVGITGPECNAAVAARRLGAEVAWLSRLPDSPLGRRVASELRGYDVDVRVDWADGGRQGLAFHERGAPPRGDQRLDDRAGVALGDLDPEGVPFEAALEGAEGTYVTGATPGLSTPVAAATARLLKAATDAGALTAFGLRYDPGQWSPGEARDTLTELFPAVDVFVADEADVAAVLDRDGGPAEVAHGLAAEWGFETVALLREHTAVAWHDSTVHEYPVVEGEVVDGSGDADAFAGAFLARLLEGADHAEALRSAMAAAALARTVPGAVPAVTRAEVERVAATVQRSRE